MIRLPLAKEIRGQQLRRELGIALGIALSVEQLRAINGWLEIDADEALAAQAQATLDAHLPQSRQTVETLARSRVNALAGMAAKDLTAAQVRDLLLGIACRLGIIDSAGRVLSYDDWGSNDS